ncbi:hypothetical protein CPB84DRAFT_1798255 [Gymnopilus junonius]|uniref:Uncharacterized protein n=1 Tax=Gymnopilus junonius TaxID=109634 RepID=A0A9P5N8E9_GYMJU|nr:hypothetical protein CPB84DRAFT_1798255 [Gymnopilus junonius]
MGALDFLKQVLENQWLRIRTLSIERHDATRLSELILRRMQQPAPHLKTFMVPIIFPGNTIFSDPDFPLFAGSAPSLQIFNSLNVPFDHRGPWVSQLRELHLWDSDNNSAYRLLNLLARMPFLEAFETRGSNTIVVGDDPTNPLPKVVLPMLKRVFLDTRSSFSDWFQVLDNLIPADDCGLWLYHHPTTNLTAKDIDTLCQLLSRHGSRYFSNRHTSNLFLYLAETEFNLRHDSEETNPSLDGSEESDSGEDEHPHDDSTSRNNFAFIVECTSTLPENAAHSFLGALSPCQFNGIRELALTITGANLSPHDPNFNAFLDSLSSVEVMETDPVTLNFLIQGSNDRDTIILPALQEVQMPFADEVSNAPVLIDEFLTWRRTSGTPICVLDLQRPFAKLLGDFSLLDDQQGLKMVWYDTTGRRVEYRCGSGKPEMLNFSKSPAWLAA